MTTGNSFGKAHEEIKELTAIPWRLITLRLMRLLQDQMREILLIKPRMIHPSPLISETHSLLLVIKASCLPLMKKPEQQLKHLRCFERLMILIGLHLGKMNISEALVYWTTSISHRPGESHSHPTIQQSATDALTSAMMSVLIMTVPPARVLVDDLLNFTLRPGLPNPLKVAATWSHFL